MAITYKFDEDGGFYVHDEDHEFVDYAEPGSPYAQEAKTEPERVVEKMTSDPVTLALSQFYHCQRWYKDNYKHMLKQMESIK